ncbi:MAG: mechanosensitive ion channel family protein [Halobacteriales archaeon]
MFQNISGNPYAVVALVVLASIAAGAVMNYVVISYLHTYTDRTNTDYDDIVVDSLEVPLITTVSLIGFSILTSIPAVTESTFLTEAQVSTFVGKPATSIIVLVWAFYLNRVVNRIVKKINKEGKASEDHGRAYEFAPVFSNVWTLIVFTLAGALILALWDYNISPLLGAAGIAGIALGVAAKETVSNFLGGLALYIDDTYTIGDYLETDKGEAGTVVAVGIRSTRLRTRNNVEITLPNSRLNAERIVNRSNPRKKTRLRIDVGVAYGTDIDDLEELLVNIAEAEELVLATPKPRTFFVEFGDSALNYTLVCWIGRPEQEPQVRHRINREIYKGCREQDIEIPYNKHDVNLYRPDDGNTAGDTVDTADEQLRETDYTP